MSARSAGSGRCVRSAATTGSRVGRWQSNDAEAQSARRRPLPCHWHACQCLGLDRHMPPWLPAGRRRHASERRAPLASGSARRAGPPGPPFALGTQWPMQRPGPGKNAPSRLQLKVKLSVPRTPPVAPAGRGSPPLAGRPGRGRSGSDSVTLATPGPPRAGPGSASVTVTQPRQPAGPAGPALPP